MKKLLTILHISLLTTALFTTSQAGNTVFYALTPNGGTHNKGAIISFTPATSTESVVYSFADGTDGATPAGSLVYDATNNLFYGTTQNGGAYSAGTIFTFNPTTNTETVVYSFGNGTDGQWPSADLTYDAADGLFFGQTMSGGGNGDGTMFTFNPTSKVETDIYDFDGTLSADVSTDFYYDATNATLIGIGDGGQYAAGDLFVVKPAVDSIIDLWDFGNGTDGSYPGVGPVAYDATNGLIYLAMEYGGANSHGAIISYNLSTKAENVAYSFAGGTDARGVGGALVYDAAKGLFYATSGGGANNQGSIFSFNPANNAESVAYSFAGGTDGSAPVGTPIYDATNGLYYMMTTTGGTNNKGTIISFNPSNNAESVVWSFGGTNDVSSPSASFAQATSTTGINTVSNDVVSVEVYPNPVQNYLTFKFKDAQPGNEFIARILDITGRELANTNYTVRQNSNTIDVSSLSAGIYFLSLSNSQEVIATQKFIKE